MRKPQHTISKTELNLDFVQVGSLSKLTALYINLRLVYPLEISLPGLGPVRGMTKQDKHDFT